MVTALMEKSHFSKYFFSVYVPLFFLCVSLQYRERQESACADKSVRRHDGPPQLPLPFSRPLTGGRKS